MPNDDIKWKTLLNIPITSIEDREGRKWIVRLREEGEYRVLLEGEKDYRNISDGEVLRKRPSRIQVKLKGHLNLNK